ncbi:hypothetical protein [Herbidospora galbida]|uniref:hypothetical protein n=1 Tax=Herbidospora galbida TaxID=2575442 RepID=UPI0014850BC6|nr:hypothetical protein [Herbidospora galbida]
MEPERPPSRVDGRSREIDLPAERADALAVLTGAARTERVAIDRDLDLWTGAGPSGAANAAASALAAD